MLGWIVQRRTPLHVAAMMASHEVVAKMLRLGANPKAKARDGSTPLHFAAAFNGNPKVISALIKGGAQVNARNKQRETPLHLASRFAENTEIVAVLLNNGAQCQGERCQAVHTVAHGGSKQQS